MTGYSCHAYGSSLQYWLIIFLLRIFAPTRIKFVLVKEQSVLVVEILNELFDTFADTLCK